MTGVPTVCCRHPASDHGAASRVASGRQRGRHTSRTARSAGSERLTPLRLVRRALLGSLLLVRRGRKLSPGRARRPGVPAAAKHPDRRDSCRRRARQPWCWGVSEMRVDRSGPPYHHDSGAAAGREDESANCVQSAADHGGRIPCRPTRALAAGQGGGSLPALSQPTNVPGGARGSGGSELGSGT